MNVLALGIQVYGELQVNGYGIMLIKTIRESTKGVICNDQLSFPCV